MKLKIRCLCKDYIIKKCKELINNNSKLIQYPKDINAENWNEKVKGLSIEEQPDNNIYVILTSKKISKKDTICYVGKSNNINNRLNQHLINKAKTTSSCLDEVRDYIINSVEKIIYISSFKVEPKEANCYVETVLQEYFKCKWNKRKS